MVRATLRQRERAVEILDGMDRVVKKDKLKRGSYLWIPQRFRHAEKAPSLCQGIKACAIGSLWVAAGIPLEEHYNQWDLPGTDNPTEWAGGWDFDASRPNKPLALALEALNQVSREWLAKPKVARAILRRSEDPLEFAEPVEFLFEGAYGTRPFGKREMLRVIRTAKLRIKAGKVQLRERYDDPWVGQDNVQVVMDAADRA